MSNTDPFVESLVKAHALSAAAQGAKDVAEEAVSVLGADLRSLSVQFCKDVWLAEKQPQTGRPHYSPILGVPMCSPEEFRSFDGKTLILGNGNWHSWQDQWDDECAVEIPVAYITDPKSWCNLTLPRLVREAKEQKERNAEAARKVLIEKQQAQRRAQYERLREEFGGE